MLRLSNNTFLIRGKDLKARGVALAGKDKIEQGFLIQPPAAILLFGWMNSQLKHLEKYTNEYQKLYPGADILIIESTTANFWKLNSTRLRSLQGVAQHIQKINSNGTKPILVHTFSNGGCQQLQSFDVLMKKSIKSDENWFRSLILDSCPGNSSVIIMHRALTAQLKSKIAKGFAGIIIFLMYGLGGFVNFMLRQPNIISSIRNHLNNRLGKAPRLYIYSKSDLLIPSHFVEESALIASEKQPVKLEEFLGTDHVAHTRGEENSLRYWKAVQDHWEASAAK